MDDRPRLVFCGLVFLFFVVPVAGSPEGGGARGFVRGLANEGVLVESGGKRVVVDFPFVVDFEWCVSPDAGQLDALTTGIAPFDSVDAFLFTHDHVDHFDPARVRAALAAHPEAILVGTAKVLERLCPAGEAVQNPLFEARPGQPIAWNGIRIEPLAAPHAKFWDVDPANGRNFLRDDGYVHVAYRVEMAGFSFTHGGDAYDIELPSGATTDLLLVDRGFLGGRGLARLKRLAERLNGAKTLLVHLGPSEGKRLAAVAASEESWLSVFAGRDAGFAVKALPERCPGFASAGPPRPELFLPGVISGPMHDLAAQFPPGGRELWLMRSDSSFDNRIVRYLCRDGAWRELGTAPIPFEGKIASPTFSPNGTQLFFDGSTGSEPPDIWTASMRDEEWSSPERLGSEVNGEAVEMFSSAAANGNLYFSSNRPGGHGGFDLYVARKTPTGYSPAENLGPSVNSAELDSHPFVDPDERYLLFDSRRPGGFGSNDLYVSFRRPDGAWTPATNLGATINSPAGEMSPVVTSDRQALFFCSDRASNATGAGAQDVWWVDAAILETTKDDWRQVMGSPRKDPAAFPPVTVPMALDHGRMTVEVGLEGGDGETRCARAWIDTGGTTVSITESLALELGLDLSGLDASEGAEQEIVTCPGISIGGLPLATDGMGVTVRRAKSVHPGIAAACVLPARCLRRLHVVFDAPAGLLVLSPPGVLEPRGEPVPCSVHPDTGLVRVEVSIDGELLPFGVDTGSAGTWVSERLTSAWRKRHPDRPTAAGAAGSTNFFGFPFEARGELTTLPGLAVGPVVVEGEVAALGLGERLFDWYSEKSAAPVVGFLGAEPITRFRLEIDFPNQTTWWSRAGAPPARDLDVVGLTLRPETDGTYTISGVVSRKGDPLLAEVRAGDRLLGVDALATTNAPMGVVVDALRGRPGDERILSIEREGKRLTVRSFVSRLP